MAIGNIQRPRCVASGIVIATVIFTELSSFTGLFIDDKLQTIQHASFVDVGGSKCDAPHMTRAVLAHMRL